MGAYNVDLKTGVITTFGRSTPIETEEIVALRNELFALRAASRLTRAEALCLSNLLLQLHCGSLRVIREEDSVFLVENTGECAGSGQQFSIDRYLGTIRDQNGKIRDSPAVAQLRQHLLTARAQPELTTEDLEQLAKTAGSFLSGGMEACVSREHEHNADDERFQLNLGCRGDAVKRVTIDRKTGVIRDLASRAEYDSPSLRNLRGKLTEEAKLRQITAVEGAEALCHGN